MCIICNAGHGDASSTIDGTEKAIAFLNAFDDSRAAMQRAAAAMLAVSQHCVGDHRTRYDRIHKEMVRQIREWNKLEEKREHGTPAPGPKPMVKRSECPCPCHQPGNTTMHMQPCCEPDEAPSRPRTD